MRGVRRFPTSTTYPNRFNRSIGDDQSAIPSQHSPVPPPFDPSIHPDMIPTPPPQEPVLSIVRHTFDSRPPNAVDFFWEELFLAGVSSGQYIVPQGYVVIIRKIAVSVFLRDTNDGLHNQAITVYGESAGANAGGTEHMQIMVDGVPTSFWTLDTQGQGGVLFLEGIAQELEFDCFVLINQGETFALRITNVTDDPTANVHVHYYGNQLLATGRNLNSEVGNYDPSLVSTEMG